jgi:Ca2+-binding RTX toxin-like protein
VSHSGSDTSAVSVDGWQFSGHAPYIQNFAVIAPHPVANRAQVASTAIFDDTSPIAIRVTQLPGTTAGLTYYNNITLVNQSGVDWTTFRVSNVSVNNTAVQGQTPAEHTYHPLFAHFHDASNSQSIPNWVDPTGMSFDTQLGFNTSKNLLTNFTDQKGINGADELWMYNGAPFANGTQQDWQDIGVHQFPLSNAAGGGNQGGDFYVVLAPNFWPVHDHIQPTAQVVHEDDGTNSYTGGAHNDLVFGYDGDDTLVGGDGDDTLVGGDGDDTLWGQNGSNWLYGGADNDTLIGGVDADSRDGDVIDGGTGRDRVSYHDETASVHVTLSGAEFAHVRIGGADAPTYDLIRNVEDVTGGVGNDVLTGDTLDNYLWGYDGDDILDGSVGFDALNGGAGFHDVASYANRTESVQLELNGNDWSSAIVSGVHEDWVIDVESIQGGSGADVLGGDANSNELKGGDGSDILHGGAGYDNLYGESGADRFEFRTLDEAGVNDYDTIFDFDRTQGDTIDLSAIDANTIVDGNQAFTFIGSDIFNGQAGQLRTDGEFVLGDVNGDSLYDVAINVMGGPPVEAGDIWL